VEAIATLAAELERYPPADDITVEDATQWVIETMDRMPGLLKSLSRHQTDVPDSFQPDDVAETVVSPAIGSLGWKLLQMWMSGETLSAMERSASQMTKKKADTHCTKARAFVLRNVRDLAFVFGLPGQIMALTQDGSDQQPAFMVWDQLGQLVRDGFDRPEKRALWVATNQRESRWWCHVRVNEDPHGVFTLGPDESFSQLVARIRRLLTQ
jgi:hypothetical protein